jgi:hypothetical protein
MGPALKQLCLDPLRKLLVDDQFYQVPGVDCYAAVTPSFAPSLDVVDAHASLDKNLPRITVQLRSLMTACRTNGVHEVDGAA